MAIGTEEVKPSIQEQHLCASNASSLLVDAQRRTQADVILAAGMTQNRLGLALVHLKAEWDRADKPRKKTATEITKRALQIKDKKGKPDVKRARTEALIWYAGAMRQRAMDLAGRSLVIGLLKEWAQFYNVDADLLSPALYHWLAPSCPACDGHGLHKMPDAPTLSKKSCLHCNGTGMWPRPHGAERVHKFIRGCIGRVRGDMAAKLHG